MSIFLLLITLPILILLYFLISSRNTPEYFKSQNIFHLKSSLIYLFYSLIWKKKVIFELTHEEYTKLKVANLTIGVRNTFGRINFLVASPEIIKAVCVKDFDHFVNRRVSLTQDIFTKKMLVFMQNEEWKEMRGKMTPTFTTGKIKRMFPLFNQSSGKMINYIDKRIKQDGEFDLMDAFSKFTLDIIATSVCGMDIKAFDQEESMFEQMGKKLQFSLAPLRFLNFLFVRIFPKVASLFGLSIWDKEMVTFFSQVIRESIHSREKSGAKLNDFIQLMMEARTETLETFEKDTLLSEKERSRISFSLNDDDIISNCVLFLFAGFDTTQSLLIFCTYQLSLNPEIQEKLREEIDKTLEEDGEWSYELVNKMTYLDMVINETLRFHPPAPFITRTCNADYTIPGMDIIIKKGNEISIPILSMHHDNTFYQNPDKFDPERFSKDNKHKINPYAFLPFGQGPRNCIGMRFALSESKLAIAQLVHNFVIEPTEKTPIPMRYQSSSSLKPKDGMWLRLKRT